MNELVNLLHGYIHPVIRRYVSFELKELSTRVVDVYHGKLLVNRVLGHVYEEVEVPILIQTG